MFFIINSLRKTKDITFKSEFYMHTQCNYTYISLLSLIVTLQVYTKFSRFQTQRVWIFFWNFLQITLLT